MISADLVTLSVRRFENLSRFSAVRHFVSTRLGGFSPPPFDSLNLGFRTADDPANVRRNRERLMGALGIPPANLVTAKQVHEAHVEVVTAESAGRGAFDYDSAFDSTDAFVTNAEDVCVMVQTADCASILFFDPVNRAIGAAHAGWKSTVRRIGQRTIETMAREFGSLPSDLVAGIGPCIGPCCFEVGPEVVAQFRREFPWAGDVILRPTPEGKAHIALAEANRRLLIESGIRAESIEVAGICTVCNSDEFFSERHTPGTGRFGAGIMLVNEICAECTSMHCSLCNKT